MKHVFDASCNWVKTDLLQSFLAWAKDQWLIIAEKSLNQNQCSSSVSTLSEMVFANGLLCFGKPLRKLSARAILWRQSWDSPSSDGQGQSFLVESGFSWRWLKTFKVWISYRVSVQGVKSLGGHFACLCRGFEFSEVKKILVLFFKTKMEILLHFCSEKSSKRAKEQKSTTMNPNLPE